MLKPNKNLLLLPLVLLLIACENRIGIVPASQVDVIVHNCDSNQGLKEVHLTDIGNLRVLCNNGAVFTHVSTNK